MPAPDATILWIDGGRVIDPDDNRDVIAPVYAINGKIVDRLDNTQKNMPNGLMPAG